MAQSTTNLGKIHVFPSETLYNQFKDIIADNDLALLKDDGAYIVAALLEQNGYVKFSNGLILQWGTNQPSPITFPLRFASKCLTVVPQLQASGDSGNMSKNRVCVSNLTTNGFDIEYPQSTYNYIAIGI